MGTARRLAVLLGLCGGVVAIAGFLNWLPHQMDTSTLRVYSNVHQAEAAAGFSSLQLPAYFPASLAWPPTEVWAGRRPVASVLMHFADRRSGALVLAIRETQGGDGLPPTRLAPQRVIGRAVVEIGGTRAQVTTGQCADHQPCNAVRWRQKGRSFAVVGRLPTAELERMARSMVHAGS